MKRFYNTLLYKKLPLGAQNVFVTLKGMVYNSVRKSRFSLRLIKELECNERLDEELLQQLQLSNLREIVKYSGANIPWYHKIFKEAGFDSASAFSFEDYAKLPILEKNTLINNRELFLPETKDRKIAIKAHTSGTTGNSIILNRDLKTIQSEWAFSQRQYRWAGIPDNARMAYLRDDRILPINNNKPPYWRNAWLTKELWLSSFHLSEGTVKAYVNELKRYQVQGIFAYPSSIYWLSVFARNTGIDMTIPSLKGIVVSSEMLYSFQEKSITEAFKVPVFDWYGSVERVIFIGTCEEGTKHIFPDYGYTEFMPSETGLGQFELIGTGFLNMAMPLLKYRTGDIAHPTDNKCPCGREFPVVDKIYGRNNDAIITPDGRRITILEIFNGIDTVEQVQVVQETKDDLILNIVPKKGFSGDNEKELIKNLQELVGPNMKILSRIIDRIPGGPYGKYRMIVSKL